MVWGSNPGRCKRWSLFQNIHTGSGFHTASYAMDTEILSRGSRREVHHLPPRIARWRAVPLFLLYLYAVMAWTETALLYSTLLWSLANAFFFIISTHLLLYVQSNTVSVSLVMRHFTYSVGYFVVPINSSITLYSALRRRLIYNDREYSFPFMTL